MGRKIMKWARYFYFPLLLAALLLTAMPSRAALKSEAYWRGYADALNTHMLAPKGARVWVVRGVIVLDGGRMAKDALETLRAQLQRSAGTTVRLAGKNEKGKRSKGEGGWFPDEDIYQGPVADPRWPHFFASYQSFQGDSEVRTAGVVGFGESFGLYRWPLGPADKQALIQLGLQFGVFGIFDMEAASKDLINADYFIGPTLSFRDAGGRNAALLRLYHQSSHLGDEYLLRSRAIAKSRINVSYEALNLLLSHGIDDPVLGGDSLRFYGGGQYIIHRDPDWLKRWSGQLGVDYIGPEIWPSLGPSLDRRGLETRFVAGLDLQAHEQVDWDPDLSLRAGLQFGGGKDGGRTFRLMAEYYFGHSPHGQFFQREIEYFGIGAHVNF